MGSRKEIKKEHWREELVPRVTEEQTQEENLKCIKAWKAPERKQDSRRKDRRLQGQRRCNCAGERVSRIVLRRSL